ncbi:copper homeostasis protein CutC [Mycetocola sp.]|uniref:copper homeostasis protein CutC n=1 Tax=Mycetocola sp. TaxID=1871042 RepID=UPI00398935DA
MVSQSLAVEIAVQGADGARIARSNGASRVELCQGLSLGGLTPSIGTIETVVAEAEADGAHDIHVLVRSRAGDFVYSDRDVDLMVRDIEATAEAGAAGVVIGALTAKGTIDRRSIRRLISAAGDLCITFHRAVDIVTSSAAAVSELGELGVNRVLTSGRATSSENGAEVLRQMVEAATGRLEIMAGGGVTIASIPLLASTGVDAVHLSARVAAQKTFGSGPGGGDDDYEVTDPRAVALAVAAAAKASREIVIRHQPKA